MTTENTTTQASAATITEKELWSIFTTNTWEATFSMGLTVEKVMPNDFLRDPGSYGYTLELSSTVADDAAEADSPASLLDCIIDDVECYLTNLKGIRYFFESIKTALAVNSYGEELRYRAPVATSKSEAA